MFSASAVVTAMTALMVVATLTSLCKLTSWWIRVFDFPRLQFAVALALLLLAQLLLLDLSQARMGIMIATTLGCLAYQLWWILPYSPLAKPKARTCSSQRLDCRLSLMTANVLTPNRNSDQLLRLVRDKDPDILVTLETDQWWQDRLDVLEHDYPHALKRPLDNLYGMHVYSKLPLHDGEVKFLVEEDKPSMHACVELRDGRRVRVHFLHPAPPSPTENSLSLERDAELLVVGERVAGLGEPIVVTGDLNDVAWSRTSRRFKKISGLLDPRIGRGLFNTFSAKHWYLRWPLDHVFHSGHFTVANLARLPSFGSDHFALYIELYLEDEHQDNKLQADDDDLQEAKEKTQRVGVKQSDVPDPH